MSELIAIQNGRGSLRWHLLTGTSAAAMLMATFACSADAESGSDRPAVWIELGGQLERLNEDGEYFSPPFLAVSHDPNPLDAIAPSIAQRSARYAVGEEGRISFAPENSNWTFSAAVRYGRSNAKHDIHQQSTSNFVNAHYTYQVLPNRHYAESHTAKSESHVVLDFSSGRDVGLGIFGRSSRLDFGVRIAQFSSYASTSVYGRPDQRFVDNPNPSKYSFPQNYFHQYNASSVAHRTFRGLGPALSWSSSVPLHQQDGAAEFEIDFGINAAVLFGRQKTQGHHQTTGLYHRGTKYPDTHYSRQENMDRSHVVTVPNFGGFAAVSLKFPNAKVSFGYRADIFFGAMDGGIDTRQTYNRDFYGPFATMSIGLGG